MTYSTALVTSASEAFKSIAKPSGTFDFLSRGVRGAGCAAAWAAEIIRNAPQNRHRAKETRNPCRKILRESLPVAARIGINATSRLAQPDIYSPDEFRSTKSYAREIRLSIPKSSVPEPERGLAKHF